MIKTINIPKILKEDKRRTAELDSPYDPILGIGSLIPRKELSYYDQGQKIEYHAPESMLKFPLVSMLNGSSVEELLSKTGGYSDQLRDDFRKEMFNLRLDHDFEFYCFTCVKIPDKITEAIIPFKLNRSQRRLIAKFEKMRLAGVPIRLILAKARQWGGSTATQIYMNWIQLRHKKRWNAAICTLVNPQAGHIRKMLETTIKNLPPELGTHTLTNYAGFANNKFLNERECIIGIGSVEKPENLRTYSIRMLHACLHPDVLVLANGIYKRAEDIIPGDEVITHNGNNAIVRNVTISKPTSVNGNGSAIKITPWLGGAVTLTPNHPVFTQRGFVNAGDLKYTDLLSMPIRPINENIKTIILPTTAARKQNGGCISAGSGAVAPLNSEIGYAFGYYLAEGSLKYQKTIPTKTRPTNITFTRHNNEYRFADRAIQALSPYIRSHKRKQRKGTLTTHEHIYGASLAKYIDRELKTKENKRIPDWMFNAGREYLTGLLCGYLCGDGSKTVSTVNKSKYISHRVAVTSVSKSLSIQIRDIALSLGYGWGSIRIMKKGVYYGRNCKISHTITWNGEAARKLRKLMGYDAIEIGRPQTEKYFTDSDKVWFRIRKLENDHVEKVVDIEVDHPDHSFRTLYFSVKNSEVGSWGSTVKKSGKDLLQTLRGGIPFLPDTMIVLESTAKGIGNVFHSEWLSATKEGSGYDHMFVPWFDIEIYRSKIEDYESFIKKLDSQYSSDGNTFWYLWELGATLEGIKWYMDYKKRENMDDLSMFQEFPSTPEEAFSSTGRPAFNPLHIKMHERTCVKPILIGDLNGESSKGPDAFKKIEFVSNPGGNLFIWALPDKAKISNRYCGFADIGGKSKGADRSVVKIFDRYWMMEAGIPEVVAVWQGNIDQDLFGWKAAQLAYFYNTALLAVESNTYEHNAELSEGNHFLTVLDEIAPYYPNLYARTNPEQVRQGVPNRYGFHTNTATKPLLVDTLNAALRDSLYMERDMRALDEMRVFEIKDNGTYGAKQGLHDDHVIATAGGLWLSTKYMDLPVEIKESNSTTIKPIINETTF